MRHARNRGFTLVELMIVIAIISIIAVIAIPNLLASKISANESAAIATLRTVHSAQAAFHARNILDRNGDGTGEYAGFRELSAAVAPRGTVAAATPLLLGGVWRVTQAPWGHVSLNGYLYQLYLPDAAGFRVAEGVAGDFGGIATTDPTLCESIFCAYAWPIAWGQSGNRTFCVNQSGQMVMTEDPEYSGPRLTSRPENSKGGVDSRGAAFAASNPARHANRITGQLAISELGYDGNIWRQVGNS